MAALNPWDYAAAGSEHAHQVALFMWAKMAEHFGVVAANDPRSYSNIKYAQAIALHNGPPLSKLKWLHAIPNGGERHGAVAGKMKAEGAKRGVYDTFLPVPMPTRHDVVTNCRFHGLYVELKKPTRRNHKDGGLSTEQLEFKAAMEAAGYCCKEAWTWQEAVGAILVYLGADNGGKGLP